MRSTSPRTRLLTGTTVLLAIVASVAAGPAASQVGLPPVALPPAPTLPSSLPIDVGGTVDALVRTPARTLGQVRVRTVDALLRRHRDVLEADPRGAPIVRREVLAFAPGDVALQRAREAGFDLRRRQALEGLDGGILVLQAPDGWSTRRALRTLRRLDPQGSYDFNHVYLSSGAALASAPPMAARPAPPPASSPALAVAQAPGPAPADRTLAGATHTAAARRIGLIDGGVDARHATLRDARLHGFGCDGRSLPSAHGTAVASILVGRAAAFSGAAPEAELFHADVYCDAPGGGAVDAIAAAFAWLVRERVPVINVSLVGPPNLLLAAVVRQAIARGTLVVAAVGNDGPAAPPLYPAAYPDVVAVTAVDGRRQVLLEAGRGAHVDFAAPGAEVPAAAAGTVDAFVAMRGTSFAAPVVAGLLSAGFDEPGRERAAARVAALAALAIDLGRRGNDATYGVGLVGETIRTGNLGTRITSSGNISAATRE